MKRYRDFIVEANTEQNQWLESQIVEGAVKAAIEDFMYEIPKEAIKELEPIMKQPRSGRRAIQVGKILTKYGVKGVMGMSATELVLDNWPTFFGESTDICECWDGYVQQGTKMKDGKEVPNCVPAKDAKKKNESLEESAQIVSLISSGIIALVTVGVLAGFIWTGLNFLFDNAFTPSSIASEYRIFKNRWQAKTEGNRMKADEGAAMAKELRGLIAQLSPERQSYLKGLVTRMQKELKPNENGEVNTARAGQFAIDIRNRLSRMGVRKESFELTEGLELSEMQTAAREREVMDAWQREVNPHKVKRDKFGMVSSSDLKAIKKINAKYEAILKREQWTKPWYDVGGKQVRNPSKAWIRAAEAERKADLNRRWDEVAKKNREYEASLSPFEKARYDVEMGGYASAGMELLRRGWNPNTGQRLPGGPADWAQAANAAYANAFWNTVGVRQTDDIDDIIPGARKAMAKAAARGQDFNKSLMRGGSKKTSKKTSSRRTRSESVSEASWGGGFESSKEAQAKVYAAAKADAKRDENEFLKAVFMRMSGVMSGKKFKQVTGITFDRVLEISKRKAQKRFGSKRQTKESNDIVSDSISEETFDVGPNGYRIDRNGSKFKLYRLSYSSGSVRFADGRRGIEIGSNFATKQDAMKAAKRDSGVKESTETKKSKMGGKKKMIPVQKMKNGKKVGGVRLIPAYEGAGQEALAKKIVDINKKIAAAKAKINAKK